MKKITPILLFFLLFVITASAQLANWSPGTNPTYTNFPANTVGQINGFGRISQMKFHATNSNKMYAVTGEGGFFAHAPRNATVQAVGDCKLWNLTYVKYLELSQKLPRVALALAMGLGAIVSKRMTDRRKRVSVT